MSENEYPNIKNNIKVCSKNIICISKCYHNVSSQYHSCTTSIFRNMNIETGFQSHGNVKKKPKKQKKTLIYSILFLNLFNTLLPFQRYLCLSISRGLNASCRIVTPFEIPVGLFVNGRVHTCWSISVRQNCFVRSSNIASADSWSYNISRSTCSVQDFCIMNHDH